MSIVNDSTLKGYFVTGAIPTQANFADLVDSKLSVQGGSISGNLAVDTDTLFVDATNDRVGINKSNPSEALDITGNLTVSGGGTFGDDLTVSGGAQFKILGVTPTREITGLQISRASFPQIEFDSTASTANKKIFNIAYNGAAQDLEFRTFDDDGSNAGYPMKLSHNGNLTVSGGGTFGGKTLIKVSTDTDDITYGSLTFSEVSRFTVNNRSFVISGSTTNGHLISSGYAGLNLSIGVRGNTGSGLENVIGMRMLGDTNKVGQTYFPQGILLGGTASANLLDDVNESSTALTLNNITVAQKRVNPLASLTLDESVPYAEATALFGSLSGLGKWTGGVLAPNGKIYGIPLNSTQILEIDPVTQTTTLFGSLSGSFKWYGGVLAPNGKIYGIPFSSTQVLEIDPVTQTTTLFGSLSGSNKWYGGVLAPNGKIYGIPRNSTQVLEIDPEAQTTTLFGSLSDTNKWFGGVLAPNGKIYGIPYDSTQVLEIDPVAQTTSLFGNLSGTAKWIGGVLAANGKIYGIPRNSTQVLEIDPEAQTTSLFGNLSGTAKWFGGVLAPNGKIYGIPQDSTQVLEIDPVTQTTTLFGSLSGSNKWIGGVLAANGKIYGIPYDSTQVLEIPTNGDGENWWALSAYTNKF